MADAEIIDLQLAAAAVQPAGTAYITSPLLVPRATVDRLRHFPEEVYDLTPTTHLSRFLKVLLGDAGAGQLRKRYLLSRMEQTLQGTHFYALDRFYGALFGVRRTVEERLDLDPTSAVATTSEWNALLAKDASYRSRILQFARAIVHGATPTGMELMAEALLSVDVDIFESYIQADASYQTYAEIEAQYGSAANLLPNPGFETNLSGWDGGGAAYARDTTQAYSGIASMRVSHTVTGEDSFRQADPIPVTAGVTYTVRAWAKVTAFNGAALQNRGLLVYGGGAASGVLTTITGTTSDWVLHTGTITAVRSDDPLIVRLYAPNGTVFWDDAFVGQSMEGLGYGALEGSGLARLSGNERREFIIRPKRPITAAEAYEVGRVIRRLKPADTRFTFADGPDVYDQVPLRSVVADSNFWRVTSAVIPTVTTEPYYDVASSPAVYIAPPVEGETPDPLPPVLAREQPVPPLTTNQTAAWSYLDSVLSVSAFESTGQSVAGDPTYATAPVQKELVGQTLVEFAPFYALQGSGKVQNGRSVSDGVLVYHPLARQDAAPLYVDQISVESMERFLDSGRTLSTSPETTDRWWRSARRSPGDLTEEVLEIALGESQLVNRIDFEYLRRPVDVEVFVAGQDDPPGQWTLLHQRRQGFDWMQWLSLMRGYTPPMTWERITLEIEGLDVNRLRVVQTRHREVSGSLERSGDPTLLAQSSYEVAVRNLNVGYRVRARADLPPQVLPPVTPPLALESAEPVAVVPIARTRDVLGSRVEWYVHEERASELLTTSQVWRCEPQPVSFAVVNFYLDVRAANGDPEVVDKFYLEPTHPGVHLTIYWSNDPGEPGNIDTDWHNDASWTPIPREYTLQKGYLSIPPTRAKHFKFEFTGLTPEPYDSLLPITRTVRLFPSEVVARTLPQTSGLPTEQMDPGTSVASTVTVPDYIDALGALREAEVGTERRYTSTEAVVLLDPLDALRTQQESWVFGFQPWHQGAPAPRFVETGVHRYAQVEINHVTKVGYLVGLKDVRAYRVNFGADDDTQSYVEHFHDFKQIEPGFTWTFNPNAMTTETSSTAVATSRVYASLHGVKAVQFATQQTPAIQLVYDDDFRDPANATRDWSNDEGWHRVGDAMLAYNPTSHSVTVQRHTTPLLTPLTPVATKVPERVVHPVFAHRPSVVDVAATDSQIGGIQTMALPVSLAGRVHAAVRLTFRTALTQPLFLQFVEEGEVVASKAITGAEGETVEAYLSHSLTGGTLLRARLVQYSASDDRFEVDTLSVFDEGITWEFSNNGGATWVEAVNVRNNEHGILTFPEPGNQLRWRVRGLRQRMSLSALKIRPHYIGQQNSRVNAAQRGANVSVYDQDIPIQDDPMFTDWHLPVPKGWFAAFKRAPSAATLGAPNITEFARFYGRPIGDEVTTSDAATRVQVHGRTGEIGSDWIRPAPDDAVSTSGSRYFRKPGDVAAATDSVTVVKFKAEATGLVRPISHPI